MSSGITFTVKDSILFTVIAGNYDFGQFRQYVQQIREQCESHGTTRVLVDLTAVQGEMPGPDRFALGELLAEALDSRIRAAFIARPEIVTRMAESVAVYRGAQLQVFFNPEEALAWLKG